MGLFDIFKKKPPVSETPPPAESDKPGNSPELLLFQLLFISKPAIDAERILAEAKKLVPAVENPDGHIFTFPAAQMEVDGALIPAQFLVAPPDKGKDDAQLPDVAFQQNWHWQQANETAQCCKHNLLVTDIMARWFLNYKQRAEISVKFLASVVKATQPDAVYSTSAQKLIDPATLIQPDESNNHPLYHICNVRLYNITGTDKKEFLMDTVGMHAIGLPDFQIRFSDFEVNDIATLLWNYAFYIYDNGDVIEDGNTLEGLSSGSRWRCEKQGSQIEPPRMVIHVQPQ